VARRVGNEHVAIHIGRDALGLKQKRARGNTAVAHPIATGDGVDDVRPVRAAQHTCSG
jgi:hypothetical protein